MKVLSVRQPWAWFMFADPPLLPPGVPRKNIENRTWPTHIRGNILIHAAQKIDSNAVQWVNETFKVKLPDFEAKLGGIVGCVRIVDCVTRHSSKWFQGPYGFVLADPYPLPFEACRGQLGFFEKEY